MKSWCSVFKRLNDARKKRRLWKQIRAEVDRIRRYMASPEVSPIVAQLVLSITAILLQKALVGCMSPPRGPHELDGTPGPGGGPSLFDDGALYDVAARPRQLSGKSGHGDSDAAGKLSSRMDLDHHDDVIDLEESESAAWKPPTKMDLALQDEIDFEALESEAVEESRELDSNEESIGQNRELWQGARSTPVASGKIFEV
mmetsp:Transcript_12679/g.24769  ORF Transcript_12679/g.24769 Transcript_12679/m.24769 type:complete len:200 (-) Transcript_12679:123-722(-)